MATSRVARALQYMEQNPGLTLTPTDVANELGVEPGQASAALQNLVDNINSGVERISRGAYRYVGVEQARKKREREQERKNSTLFELRGTLKDGRLILQDEDGEELYIAQSLSEVL